MRHATIRYNGGTIAALVDGASAKLLPFRDVRSLLTNTIDIKLEALTGTEIATDNISWAPLIPRPEKIICVGLNFLSHIEEMGHSVPNYPTLFSKYARALIGARDPIQLPACSNRVDWEAEMAVVIGREVRNVHASEAREAIAGFTVMNDVSMRDYQHRTGQWLQGKTFEQSTPLGPMLVSGDEIDWASDLIVRCFVDGEKVQEMRTSDMIFRPEDVVAYMSRIITLEPGDIISLGTAAGVGDSWKPPRYLLPGQVLHTEIEGLGQLVNECVGELSNAD